MLINGALETHLQTHAAFIIIEKLIRIIKIYKNCVCVLIIPGHHEFPHPPNELDFAN